MKNFSQIVKIAAWKFSPTRLKLLRRKRKYGKIMLKSNAELVRIGNPGSPEHTKVFPTYDSARNKHLLADAKLAQRARELGIKKP
jgi:hypothetical protein